MAGGHRWGGAGGWRGWGGGGAGGGEDGSPDGGGSLPGPTVGATASGDARGGGWGRAGGSGRGLGWGQSEVELGLEEAACILRALAGRGRFLERRAAGSTRTLRTRVRRAQRIIRAVGPQLERGMLSQMVDALQAVRELVESTARPAAEVRGLAPHFRRRENGGQAEGAPDLQGVSLILQSATDEATLSVGVSLVGDLEDPFGEEDHAPEAQQAKYKIDLQGLQPIKELIAEDMNERGSSGRAMSGRGSDTESMMSDSQFSGRVRRTGSYTGSYGSDFTADSVAVATQRARQIRRRIKRQVGPDVRSNQGQPWSDGLTSSRWGLAFFSDRRRMHTNFAIILGASLFIVYSSFIVLILTTPFAYPFLTKTGQTGSRRLGRPEVQTVLTRFDEESFLHQFSLSANLLESHFVSVANGIAANVADQARLLLDAGVAVPGSDPRAAESVLRPLPFYPHFAMGLECLSGSAPTSPVPSADNDSNVVSNQCPEDLGPLSPRITEHGNIFEGIVGSIQHPSTFTFVSESGHASGHEEFEAHLQKYSSLRTTIEALSAMQGEFSIILEAFSRSTVQIYVAAEIPDGEGGHQALRLTYPGYSLAGYTDPSRRPWFRDAPESTFSLHGPYIESITKEKVLTLSTKRTFTSPANGGKEVTVVGAAVLHMPGLEDLMRKASVLGASYGLLAKLDGEVLYHGGGMKQDELFAPEKGTNLKLWQIDPELLPMRDKIFSGERGSVKFTKETKNKGSGEWLVAYHPVFQERMGDRTNTNLVYISLVNLEQPSRGDVDPPRQRIVTDAILLSALAAILVFLVTMFCSLPLMPPLRYLQRYSTAIFKATAMEWGRESEERYEQVVTAISDMENSQQAAMRNMEFRPLVLGFNKMAKRLAIVENVKKSTPRFPKNPLHESKELLLAGRTQECLLQIQKAGPSEQRSITTFSERLSLVLVPRILSSLETGLDEADLEVEDKSSEVSAFSGNLIRWMSWKFLCAVAFTLTFSSIVAIGILDLEKESELASSWLSEFNNFLEIEQVRHVDRVASMRGSTVECILNMFALQTILTSNFASRLIAGELSRSDQDKLRYDFPSFSMDCDWTPAPGGGCWGGSAFAKKCGESPSGADFTSSGYFSKSEPRQSCFDDEVSLGPNSRLIIDHHLTRLSSLMDLKFRAYAERLFQVEARVALENAETSLVRAYPYRHKAYGNPTECYYDADARLLKEKYSFCKLDQQNCLSGDFAPYNPKCRAWYQSAIQMGNPRELSFSAGSTYGHEFDSTFLPFSASTPITSNGTERGELLGAVNMIFSMPPLEAYATSGELTTGGDFGHGSAALVLTENPTSVLFHSKIRDYQCHDERLKRKGFFFMGCFYPDFTAEEWAKFQGILTQMGRANSEGRDFSARFSQKGTDYFISGKPVRIFTNEKILFSAMNVAPLQTVRPVRSVAAGIQGDIRGTLKAREMLLIVGMTTILASLAVMMALVVRVASRSVETMHAVCESIVRGELLKSPSEPRQKLLMSLEIRKVLEAFSSTLVILRCGLDFFFSGSMKSAVKNFEEAEQLFSSVSNDRGLGIARNNLAIAHMALSNTNKAGEKFMLSIGNAQDRLQQASEGLRQATYKMEADDELRQAAISDLRQAMRVLSERMGNYASFLLTDEGMADGEDPGYVIEKGLHIDKALGNRYGWVIKQSLLGRLALRQGRFVEAQQIFELILEEVAAGRGGMNMPSSPWDQNEVAAAQQLSMYNSYLLAHANGQPQEEQRKLLADCISVPHCHDPLMGTLSSAFHQLVELSQTAEERSGLKLIARACRLNVARRRKEDMKKSAMQPSARRRRRSKADVMPPSAISILESF